MHTNTYHIHETMGDGFSRIVLLHSVIEVPTHRGVDVPYNVSYINRYSYICCSADSTGSSASTGSTGSSASTRVVLLVPVVFVVPLDLLVPLSASYWFQWFYWFQWYHCNSLKFNKSLHRAL